MHVLTDTVKTKHIKKVHKYARFPKLLFGLKQEFTFLQFLATITACSPLPLTSVTSAGVKLQQLEQTVVCLQSFTGTTESTSEKVRAVVYNAVCVILQDLNTGSPLFFSNISDKSVAT